jgi:hypothetical protein
MVIKNKIFKDVILISHCAFIQCLQKEATYRI